MEHIRFALSCSPKHKDWKYANMYEVNYDNFRHSNKGGSRINWAIEKDGYIFITDGVAVYSCFEKVESPIFKITKEEFYDLNPKFVCCVNSNHYSCHINVCGQAKPNKSSKVNILCKEHCL